MARLHLFQSRPWPLFLETCVYSVVNVLVLYLFLTKPFTWIQEPNAIQRFMW
ncbi:hypothetical protein HMI55_005757 [Coelomomyces lativittatus]|nr:hypothetical protein HMI55_005757 [Coelomomyces lativittatus]